MRTAAALPLAMRSRNVAEPTEWRYRAQEYDGGGHCVRGWNTFLPRTHPPAETRKAAAEGGVTERRPART
eukprot:11969662-Alexandrium_andersonii.AAC.1